MEIGKLSEWSPWWENAEYISKLTGINRQKYSSLLDSAKIMEVTIITGVRRSGKSTLMYQIVSNLLKSGVKPEQILFVNFT